MASTTLYCGRDDIRKRLTQAGVTYVADDRQRGSVSEQGLVDAIDSAIEYAGGLIDAALWSHLDVVPIAQDDGSRNTYLKHLAVDLACERAAQRGGGNVPQSLTDAAILAREELEEIGKGKRPPGIEYPVDGRPTELRELGRPVIASASHVGRHRRRCI